MTSIHIPVLWIPAIPAGMTRFYRLVYNGERRSVGTMRLLHRLNNRITHFGGSAF